MVHLVLSSPRGAQGFRSFPYSGYLGLTPVKVEGVVATQVDAHSKSIRAKSISVSVRCYESRQGPLNSSRSNLLADYTQLLWSKPDHVEYQTISDMAIPFQIVLPVNSPGFSTATFVDYRCVWRIEAVLEHAPVYGVGSCQAKHFDLLLIRYDVPTHEPSPPRPLLNLQTTKPKAPRILYCVHSPTSPIGPRDQVSIPIYLQPLDPTVLIRGATLTVERRIQFKEIAQPQQPSPSTATGIFTHSNSQRASHSRSSSSISTSSYHEHTLSLGDTTSTALLIPKQENLCTKRKRPATAPALMRFSAAHAFSSSKVISDLITGTESSGSFSRDRSGILCNALTLQWPAPKSHSSWAIGETIESALVSVKFFVHVKVIVSSPFGVDSMELAEKELLVVSTSDAERKLAISRQIEHTDSRPKRSRKGRESLGYVDNKHPTASSHPMSPSSRPRRPHTSAGIRDSKPPPLPSHVEPGGAESFSNSVFQSDEKLNPDLTSTKLLKTPSKSTVSSTSTAGPDTHVVREWDEELALIETRRSRRFSDWLGFPWKRRRSTAQGRQKD